MKNRTPGHGRREQIRKRFFPEEVAWTGETDVGWFRAPRTLSLVLQVLKEEKVSGKYDPRSTYLELWTRHMSAGVIEMAHEGDHAYAAGFSGTRGIRTWQERMRCLEKIGLVKSKAIGNQRYKYVLLVHPGTVLQGLYKAGVISRLWWETYCARRIETGEASVEDGKSVPAQANVISLEDTKRTA